MPCTKNWLPRESSSTRPPQTIRPGVKAAYFHDPDGMTVEFVQYS